MSIPNNTQTAVLRTNSARSENMYLDSESLPHLMGVLSNLYSDAVLAVIREYSTNARDSNVAAGKADTPIRVTLPTHASRMFVVSDDGVGLSEEEVFRIYGGYGVSTKRESNDFTGQLGLGCKSALAYTSMFSLVSVKDGVKTTYSIHKDEKGIPSITRLSSVNTDSGNGVTVSIPVEGNDIYRFSRSASEFFGFWDVKPEGVSTVNHIENALNICDGVYLVRGSYTTVVMGGVPYRVAWESANNTLRGTIIYADMGEVDFTPSREDLYMTKRTLGFLENVTERIEKASVEYMEKLIANAKSWMHALWEYNRAAIDFDLASRSKVAPVYKGRPLDRISGRVIRPGYSTEIYSLPTNRVDFSKLVVMTDPMPQDKVNAYYIQKARQYVKDTDKTIFIPFEDQPDDFYTELLTKDELYKATATPRTASSDTIQVRRMYSDYSVGNIISSTTLPADSIFTTRSDIERLRNRYQQVPINEVVYVIHKNKVKQAKELGAKSLLEDIIPAVEQRFIDNLTDDQLTFFCMQERASGEFTSVHSEVVRTTGGSKELQIVRNALRLRSRYPYDYTERELMRNVRYRLDNRLTEKYNSIAGALAQVRKDYPMLVQGDDTIQRYIDERTK